MMIVQYSASFFTSFQLIFKADDVDCRHSQMQGCAFLLLPDYRAPKNKTEHMLHFSCERYEANSDAIAGRNNW